jgi:hypothetical protein
VVVGLAQLPRVDGRSAACVALDDELVRCLHQLWRHGWQPADLVRLAAREAGPRARPLLVDALANAMTPFEGTPIHPAWTAQLTELAARRWWSLGASPLHERTASSSAERIDVLVDAARLARVLAGLGPIHVLVPPPGSPRTWDPAEASDQRLLSKVRALLAKAESTTFPEEAEALTAKAQELMARHEIDAALLHPRPERPECRRVAIDDPYAEQKALLLQGVADANGCRSVWSKWLGASTVVGYDEQLDLVELLYTSLLVQSTTAMVSTGRDARNRRQPSFRRAFLQAYAVRVSERLTATNSRVVEDASAEHGERLLPVLAARRSAVDERVDELFPSISRSGSRRVDVRGWLAGQEAADRADLGQPRVRDAPDGQLFLPGTSSAA